MSTYRNNIIFAWYWSINIILKLILPNDESVNQNYSVLQ